MGEAAQQEIEAAGMKLLLQIQRDFVRDGLHPGFAKQFQEHAARTLTIWSELPEEMFSNFSDNCDINKMSRNYIPPLGNGFASPDPATLGYPVEWIDLSEKPPPVPREDQCPPLCPESATRHLGLRVQHPMDGVSLVPISYTYDSALLCS